MILKQISFTNILFLVFQELLIKMLRVTSFLIRPLSRSLSLNNKHFLSTKQNGKSKQQQQEEQQSKREPPELPVHCCMSNCENCVWITYAEELVRYYENSDPTRIEEAINENVQDSSLKAYIRMELKARGILKK